MDEKTPAPLSFEHRGFSATATWHDDNNGSGPYLHGLLERRDESGNNAMDDFVNFIAYDEKDAKRQFESAVDDYLEFCREIGKEF